MLTESSNYVHECKIDPWKSGRTTRKTLSFHKKSICCPIQLNTNKHVESMCRLRSSGFPCSTFYRQEALTYHSRVFGPLCMVSVFATHCAKHHPFQHPSTSLNHWIFCGKHQGEVATRTLVIPTMRPGTANCLQTWRRDIMGEPRGSEVRNRRESENSCCDCFHKEWEWVDSKRWRKYEKISYISQHKNTKLLF